MFKETEIDNIPQDWSVSELGEICEIITDGSHFSPKEVSSRYFMASVKDMRYNCFDFQSCKTISENDFNMLVKGNCSPKQGDILISKDGANCLDLIFVYNQPDRIVLLSSIAIVRLKTGFDPYFYAYYLLSPNAQYFMRNSLVSGSAIPRVVLKDIRKLLIPLIPHNEQYLIASVLKNLDNKINLLHRNNKTLEQLAETLYRQWFEEEDIELIRLGDTLKTTSGGTPSRAVTDYYTGNIPWIKSKELQNGFILDTEEKITDEALKNSSAKKLPPFTVLIAMYGATVGEIGISTEVATCNQAIAAIPETKDYPFTFLFNFFKSIKDDLINLAVGAAQQNISQVLIQDLLLPITGVKVKQYHDVVGPLYEKVLHNTKQIKKLEVLRDTILPKLMGGTLKINTLTNEVICS